MQRSRGLAVLIPGVVLAGIMFAAPASAVIGAPIPLTEQCATTDSAGVTSAIGTAAYIFAPGATVIEVPCNAPLVQPLGRFTPITSHFGIRVHPITGLLSMHYGTDYARSGITGAEIRSIAGGVVTGRIDSFALSGTGNSITISHDGGYRSQYMHMIRPTTLIIGDRVAAGHVIGHVGSTGGSTGSHLHLEVRLNGTHIDPAPYLADAPFLG